MGAFRSDLLSSLVVLPITIALGHLPPAIGGGWAAVGKPVWDFPVLTLLFSVHTFCDSFDKYKDIPKENRPRASLWLLWTCSLLLLVAWSSYVCGYTTALRALFGIGLQILWTVRLTPVWTPKRGFFRVKLKELLGPFKSVFAGVTAGLMATATASHHACLTAPRHCTSQHQRWQALAYAILYNFVRESIYDARDIEEDNVDGITTMATTLGVGNTIGALSVAAVVGEAWIGGNVRVSTVARALGVVGLSSLMAAKPRENIWAWAIFSLLALVPAWNAQAGLSIPAP